MSKPIANPEIPPAQRANRFWVWCLRSPMVCGLLAIIGVVVLFYAVENRRGKRAWERCKQTLAAQGAVMDQAAQATTAIPDHLNVFKAPGMFEWFLSPTQNELASPLGTASRKKVDSVDLIEITVVSPTNQSTSSGSDLCLDYDPPLLALAGATEIESVAWKSSLVIPLIVMDSVPLSDAIKNLAVQDGRKYQLDSNIISSWRSAGLPEPCVTVRWENVTAFQALQALLVNYNLVWIEDPTSHIGRISIKSEFSSIVQLTPAARAQVQKIVTQVSSLTGTEVHTLKASQGFVLYHQDNPSAGLPINPARITVRSANVPCVQEVEAFFPGPLPRFRAASGLRALPSGTNSFRVFADPPRFCSAEDYLARTDPGKPAFDLMREALKRPYARMDGDYHRAVISPPRNFVGVRIVSQTLAQRAQAYLLLGQPEQALEEVTLLHLSAVVEADPLILVGAMIETAITAIYVEVVRDGLRMGAWREPQLIALQRQLETIHLGPLLVDGLSNERLAKCRIIETASASEFAEVFDPNGAARILGEAQKSGLLCPDFRARRLEIPRYGGQRHARAKQYRVFRSGISDGTA